MTPAASPPPEPTVAQPFPTPPSRPTIDVELVRRLVATQFPRWADLPVRPVAVDGWDNRTFHLGSDMTVRLPSDEGYVPQVAKEHRWLPILARRLPLPIPVPLAQGSPALGYPFAWSIYRWIEGDVARAERIEDLTGFAIHLAEFLVALQAIPSTDGPAAGQHSEFRGCPLDHFDAATRRAIAALDGHIDAEAAIEVWQDALGATWHGGPVWFHGDVAVDNLLVRDGRLSAVIDFGCCGVGDPACDVTIAWTLFSGRSRAAFRDVLAVDPATWVRGRGWTIWKALIVFAGHVGSDPAQAAAARRVIDEVLREYEESR
jgi:aminoglycoside phosphotransferase (APT) family kinase protein